MYLNFVIIYFLATILFIYRPDPVGQVKQRYKSVKTTTQETRDRQHYVI